MNVVKMNSVKKICKNGDLVVKDQFFVLEQIISFEKVIDESYIHGGYLELDDDDDKDDGDPYDFSDKCYKVDLNPVSKIHTTNGEFLVRETTDQICSLFEAMK